MRVVVAGLGGGGGGVIAVVLSAGGPLLIAIVVVLRFIDGYTSPMIFRFASAKQRYNVHCCASDGEDGLVVAWAEGEEVCRWIAVVEKVTTFIATLFIFVLVELAN
jgi:hypothetical protein